MREINAINKNWLGMVPIDKYVKGQKCYSYSSFTNFLILVACISWKSPHQDVACREMGKIFTNMSDSGCHVDLLNTLHLWRNIITGQRQYSTSCIWSRHQRIPV